MVRLVFTAADLAPLELVPGPNALGRTKECALVVAHADLSRRHAQLTLDPSGEVSIEDLGSRNGTFLNGARVEGKVRVAPGDRVRFGQCEAVLETDAAPAPAPAPKMVGETRRASPRPPSPKAEAAPSPAAAPAPPAPAAAPGTPEALAEETPAASREGSKARADSAGKVRTDSAGKVRTDSAGKIRSRGRGERKKGSRAVRLLGLLALLGLIGGSAGAVAVFLFRARTGGASGDVAVVASRVASPSPRIPSGAGTPEPRGEDVPGPDKPTPDQPTPDKPTPDKPTLDTPTPDKPTPDTPTPDKPTPEKPTPDTHRVVPSPAPSTPGPELPEPPEGGPLVADPSPPPGPSGPDAPGANGSEPGGRKPQAPPPEPEDPAQVEVAALLKRAATDPAAKEALRKRRFATLRHEGALGPDAAKRVLDLVRERIAHSGDPVQLVAPALARALRAAALKLEVHDVEVRTSYVQDYAHGFGRLVGKQRLAPHPKTVKVEIVELAASDAPPRVLGSYSKATPALEVAPDSARGLSEAEVWATTIDAILKALAAWSGKV